MKTQKLSFKQILALITFTVLLFCLVLNLSSVWKGIGKFFRLIAPVTLGLGFAYVMNILMRMWEDKVFAFMKRSKKAFIRKMLRPLSIVLTILVFLGLIAILLAVVLPGLQEAVMTLANKLPGYFNDLKAWGVEFLGKMEFDTEWLEEFTIDWKTLTDTLSSFFDWDSATSIFGTASTLATSLAGGVVNVVFSSVIAIYFLAQKERICAFVRRAVTAFLPEKVRNPLFHVTALAHDVFGNFIRGQCAEAVILGALSYIGMVIFGFEYAGIIAVVIGCTAVVPIVGALVGEVFGAFLILTVSPLRALFFLMFILVLQQLEGSLIYPKVVGTSVGLPGIIVFSAVLIGGNIGGILGALLAVPVCAVLYTLFREAMAKRQAAAEAQETAEVVEE